MKTETIKQRALAMPGVERLNDMQLEMASTDARNIILIAPTGSGKTVAFALRLLRNVDPDADGVKAVVLAPSRELVIQLASVIRPLAAPLKVVSLYGGHSFDDETNSLAVSPDIIIATPGRLVDHINRHTVFIQGARSLVIDEYDKMLELGFSEQMRRIVSRLKHLTLKLLTSATPLAELPDFIGSIADFVTIDYADDQAIPEAVLTIVEVDSPEADKLGTLMQILQHIAGRKAVVFVNHRESAERVHSWLAKQHVPAGLYHGALDQQQRHMAVEMFHNGTTPILVATDLAARGLDISNVGAVIHYHIPVDEQAWTHRNGRSGRQGAEGTVFIIKGPAETLPDYITPDIANPDLTPATGNYAPIATLYFNAGKKEKISRGDILGYLIHKGELQPSDIGRITVDDHYALAAVPADSVAALLTRLAPHKLKNRRIRTTLLR